MTSPKYNPWQCRTCQSYATLRDDDVYRKEERITNYTKTDLRFIFTTVVCKNPKCQKIEANIVISEKPLPELPNPPLSQIGQAQSRTFKIIRKKGHKPLYYKWQLLPKSLAKNFPDYIPSSIREDYQEACLIKNLSPKASATLARRCMQTIIRHFWGISDKRTLHDEINALSDNTSIDPKIIKGFHALKEIGNIGAHMEKDIGLIIGVDTNEADKLIDFIEYLIQLTYISKHEKEKTLESMTKISVEKKTKKSHEK